MMRCPCLFIYLFFQAKALYASLNFSLCLYTGIWWYFLGPHLWLGLCWKDLITNKHVQSIVLLESYYQSHRITSTQNWEFGKPDHYYDCKMQSYAYSSTTRTGILRGCFCWFWNATLDRGCQSTKVTCSQWANAAETNLYDRRWMTWLQTVSRIGISHTVLYWCFL